MKQIGQAIETIIGECLKESGYDMKLYEGKEFVRTLSDGKITLKIVDGELKIEASMEGPYIVGVDLKPLDEKGMVM